MGIEWHDDYEGYLHIFGRLVSGETYEEYNMDIRTTAKIIRTIAIIDAVCVKKGDAVRARSFANFKKEVKYYLKELDAASNA
jgi:hypothetical protein